MRQFAALLACLLTVVPTTQPQRESQAEQAVFRTRTDAVSVVVSVQNGRVPVAGLTANDFLLLDNGVPQTLDAMAVERVPLDLTLVLTARPEFVQFDTAVPRDQSNESIRGLESIEGVRRLLTPEDRLRIVFINCEIHSDLIDTRAPIPRSRFLGPPWGPPCNLRVRLADGVFYALASPVPPDRRHLVVLFADGWDTGSAIEIAKLPQLAAHSDAVMHAALWVPQGPATGYFDQRRQYTSDPAVGAAVDQTGGMLLSHKDIGRTLAAVVTEFRNSYLLRYTPQGVSVAGWHDLTVSVRGHSKYFIRARRGYDGG